MRRVLALSCWFCLGIMAWSGGVRAEDMENTRDSLMNLKGVYVVVEALTPEVEGMGITTDTIRGEAESRLAKAGIPVLSRSRWFRLPGNPHLYINAHVVPLPESGELIYSINVGFRQNVYPVREAVQIVDATTWSLRPVTGITGRPQKIRRAAGELVGRFIRAFRSVNR